MTTMGSPFDAVMIEAGKGNEGGQGGGQEECLYHMWRNYSMALRLNLGDKI